MNKTSRGKFVRDAAMGTAGVLCIGMNDASSRITAPILPASCEKTLIIDSHCHAWNYWPYDVAVPDSQTRGSAEQLIDQMDLFGVEQATIVTAQIEHNRNNNEYVAKAVKKYSGRLHQFADVDSSWSSTYHKPGAAKRLEAVVKRFRPKGFTHYLSNDDDASWFNTQDGIDFMRVASDAGLIASISCSPRHQAALRKVAERFPLVPVLCHHMSHLKASEPAPWKNLQQVLESAKLPNMYLKFSGFAYHSDEDKKFEYPYTNAKWLYEACYEKFGQRMVWGCDFPVVKFYMTYQHSLEAFRRHCTFVRETDKKAILGGTLQKLLLTNTHNSK